jgi:hypothetical protein
MIFQHITKNCILLVGNVILSTTAWSFYFYFFVCIFRIEYCNVTLSGTTKIEPACSNFTGCGSRTKFGIRIPGRQKKKCTF